MFSSHLVLCICCVGFVASSPANLPKQPASDHTNLLKAKAKQVLKAMSNTRSSSLRRRSVSLSPKVERDQGMWPIVVPLTRQLVPVTNKMGMTVSYKSAFYGTISLGDDQSQEFSMVFDTGSSQVIVPSSKCQSEACVKHRRFHRASSKSAVDIDSDGTEVADNQDRDTVSVGFGTGQVVGEFIKETACLGLGSGTNRWDHAHCMKDLKLISATEMSDKPFASFTFDGVIGLGLPEGAINPSFSFLHMLSSHPAGIKDPHVGFYVDGRNGGNSEISFGGVNTKRLKSPLQWSKVLSPENGHWAIALKAVRVGGVALDVCGEEGCKAIVDTGTSHLGVPSSIHASLQQSLANRHPFQSIEDCRDSTGPDLELDLGEFSIKLSAKEYSKRLPQPYGNQTGSGGSGPQEGICWPQIMRLGLQQPYGHNLFLLGEPVMRKYYTAFDWVEKKVGFALSSPLEEEDEEIISLVQVQVTLRRIPAKVSFGIEMTVTSLTPCSPVDTGFIDYSSFGAEML